jgi:hypothetical protein
MNDNEEKDLTYDELRALAEEQDRRDGLSSKARGQREKREEVSEEHLLSLGGKKAGAEIVFGPEGDTQLIFRPSREGLRAARWISLKSKISHLTLSGTEQGNRGLGKRMKNKAKKRVENRTSIGQEKDQPSIVCRGGELLACHAEITELQEKAKQEATSAIEQEASEANYAHPKPKIEAKRRARHSEKATRHGERAVAAGPGTTRRNRPTVEALSKGLGKKMQIALSCCRMIASGPRTYKSCRACQMLAPSYNSAV